MSVTGKPWRAWRWSLRTMLLVVLAASAWLAHARLRTLSARLEADIARMESLLPDRLVISDPEKAAAVLLPPTWYDENIWDLHLPDGQEYVMNLASRQIDREGLTPVAYSAPLTPGRHRIELVRTEKLEDVWRTKVLVDGEVAIVCEEPLDWNSGSGSTGGGLISGAKTFDPGEEIVLFRRRWAVKTGKTTSNTPAGPCAGLLLWVSPDPGPAD